MTINQLDIGPGPELVAIQPVHRIVIAATFTAEPVQDALDFWIGELNLSARSSSRHTTRSSSSCSTRAACCRGIVMASTSYWSGSKTGYGPGPESDGPRGLEESLARTRPTWSTPRAGAWPAQLSPLDRRPLPRLTRSA